LLLLQVRNFSVELLSEHLEVPLYVRELLGVQGLEHLVLRFLDPVGLVQILVFDLILVVGCRRSKFEWSHDNRLLLVASRDIALGILTEVFGPHVLDVLVMNLKVDVPQVQVLLDDEIKMRRGLSPLQVLVVEPLLDVEIVLFLEFETSLKEILFEILFDVTFVLFNV